MILPKVCFFGYLNAIILRDYSAGNPNSKTNDILCLEETCAQEVAEHVHQRTNLDTENETTLQLQSQLWAYEIGKQAGVFVCSLMHMHKKNLV